MTELTRQALASVPLTEETVQSFFDGSRSGTAEQCLTALCVSHERLRAELEGAEILLAENWALWTQIFAAAPNLCWRDCRECGTKSLHIDNVTPWVLCRKCGSTNTRLMRKETAVLRGEVVE